jgi:hypothetical protein
MKTTPLADFSGCRQTPQDERKIASYCISRGSTVSTFSAYLSVSGFAPLKYGKGQLEIVLFHPGHCDTFIPASKAGLVGLALQTSDIITGGRQSCLQIFLEPKCFLLWL